MLQTFFTECSSKNLKSLDSSNQFFLDIRPTHELPFDQTTEQVNESENKSRRHKSREKQVASLYFIVVLSVHNYLALFLVALHFYQRPSNYYHKLCTTGMFVAKEEGFWEQIKHRGCH